MAARQPPEEESSSAIEAPAGTADGPFPAAPASSAAAIADRFRRLTMWLIATGCAVALGLLLAVKVRVDPRGTFVLDWVLASLLLLSRVWWNRTGHQRIADAAGTVAAAMLGGMSGGAVAMLSLRLHFPLADSMLQSADHALGVDGIEIVKGLLRQGHWTFSLMAPAYNYTLQIFFGSLIVLALLRERVEAWRASFCFVGTLLTACLVAMFVPAKGLGVWAPSTLLAVLPEHAMRTFWPHFDDFYFAADPILRMQVVDGVISFPSFHTVVGFIVLAMWRKNVWTLAAAGMWLAVMLISIFPGGGHYFVDLLGGFAVWLAWFACSRRVEQRVFQQVALFPA